MENIKLAHRACTSLTLSSLHGTTKVVKGEIFLRLYKINILFIWIILRLDLPICGSFEGTPYCLIYIFKYNYMVVSSNVNNNCCLF